MLLMVEEGIRGGMCEAVYRYDKVNNKYMKNYDKSIKSSYIEYLDAHNYTDGLCLKNYQQMVLNGQKETIYQNLMKNL